MMLGYFDADGICLQTDTVVPEHIQFTYGVRVPDGAEASKIWYDIATSEVKLSEPVDPLKVMNAAEAVSVGDEIELKAPHGCVLVIDGERCDVKKLRLDEPKKVWIELKGRLSGLSILDVRSWLEERKAHYLSPAEQLGQLYDIMKDLAPESEFVKTQAAIKAEFPKS